MEKADKKIYLSPPEVSPKTYSYVKNALASGWVAPYGEYIDLFEQKIRERTRATHCVALSSGTAALHLALRALGVNKDDTVYCSSFSFIASANPIVYVGAKPIFIDSECDTWNMCPDALEKALSTARPKKELPKAMVLAHTYGMPAKIDQIIDICAHYKVPVIEDAAEALGSYFNGKALGTFGDIGVFSFNGNKIITASTGGAAITNNDERDKKMRYLAAQAKDDTFRYLHADLGYNYRMSHICAAVGVAQIEELEQRAIGRRENFEYYREEIHKAFSDICFQEEPDERFFSNRWLSCIFRPTEKNNFTRLREELAKNQVETRPLWYPLHLQPIFKGAHCHQKEKHNVAETLFQGGLCLPSGNSLTMENKKTIISLIIKYLFMKK